MTPTTPTTRMQAPRQIGYPEAGSPVCSHCNSVIDRCANAECNEALRPEDFETYGVGNHSCWVERPIDSKWTVAYRIVVFEDRNLVGEMRIFPTSPNNERAGEWHDGDFHGIAARVPGGGIRAGMLRQVSPTHDNDLEGAIAIADQYRDNGDPRMFQTLECGGILVETLDVDGNTIDTKSEVRRTKHAVSWTDMALAGAQYIELKHAGHHEPFKAVGREFYVAASTIEKSWFPQARKHGLMTTAKKGEIPKLTPEGERYLEMARAEREANQ